MTRAFSKDEMQMVNAHVKEILFMPAFSFPSTLPFLSPFLPSSLSLSLPPFLFLHSLLLTTHSQVLG